MSGLDCSAADAAVMAQLTAEAIADEQIAQLAARILVAAVRTRGPLAREDLAALLGDHWLCDRGLAFAEDLGWLRESGGRSHLLRPP